MILGRKRATSAQARRAARIRARRAAQAKRVKAHERLRNVLPLVTQLRCDGVLALSEIAAELNRREIRAPRGGSWHRTTVMRILVPQRWKAAGYALSPEQSVAIRRARMAAFVARLRATIDRLFADCETAAQLANKLNRGGHKTFWGIRWTARSLKEHLKRYSPELHQKLRKLWYATAQRAFDPDAARTRRAAFVGELRAGIERLIDSNCKTHRQLIELLNEGGHWTFAGARWTVESLRRYLKRHCPDLPEKLRVQRAADRAQAKAVLDGIARHRGINREPPLTEKDAAAELTRRLGRVISRNQIRKLSPRRRGHEPFWNGERRAEVRALHQAGKTLDEIAWEYSDYGKPRNEIKRVLKEELGPLLEGPKRVSASAPPPYLASWIEERCDRGWALRSLTSELYDDYLQWATAAGDIAVPVKRFSTELESLAVIRWRHPRTRRHGFAGIALKRCYEEQRSIPPPVVAQVTQKYLSGEESFAAWRDARCDLRSTLWSLTRELHEDFMQWTKEAGQFYFVSEKQFCDWLKNLRLDRRRDPQTRRHGFQGIALKTPQ